DSTPTSPPSTPHHEPDTAPPHGVQDPRFRRALAQLSAQPVEVNVDRLILADRWLAPYLLQQFPPRHHPTRPGREVGEQVELLARQRQRSAIQVRLALAAVQAQTAGLDDDGLGSA